MIYIKKKGGGGGEWSANGNGIAVTKTLNDATGDEAAVTINYTTNKASSGNDTGIEINMTDTASPGTSYGIEYLVGASSKFKVRNDGWIINAGGISTGSILGSSIATSAVNSVDTFAHTNTQTSGSSNTVKILPTYSQSSGTAANTDLLINRTETAVGSGTQLLVDAQVDDVSKFNIDSAGEVDFAGSSYSAGDPSTTGYFVVKIAGTQYQIPVVAV